MSITIRPKGEVKIEGGNPDGDQQFEYWVTGDNDYAAVMVECEIRLDPFFNLKIRKGVSLEQKAVGVYVATATYASLKPKDPKYAEETGQATIQFEISGVTQHLTQSISTIRSYSSSPRVPAPDYKGAVNVSDKKVEGYDDEFPEFKWSEKYFIPAEIALSIAYRDDLLEAYNKTNKAAFRGHPAKAVRFKGTAGGMSEKYPDYFELTFNFLGAKKATGLTFGDITDVEKGPHELLWVQYDETEDDSAKKLIKTPRFVYVEQIAKEFDYNKLRLPV